MVKLWLLRVACCFTINSNIHAQYNFSKVDEWLDDNTSLMGGRSYLMIYKDAKIIYSHAVNEQTAAQKFMQRRMNQNNPDEATVDYTSTTRQPIASCSKWLSAALVMTFVDEGKLNLTDTVGKFLPVLSQHGKGNITISECLSHLTGIDEPPLNQSLKDMRSLNSMDDAINLIANMQMEGKPGTVFHYSNAGLQIAAAVIEKISGENFEDLFAERIAKPLDMKNTDFGHHKVPLPAGGASSTPEDYMHFLEMILHKGVYDDKRILSESSIAQMQVNRLNKDVKIGYSPAEAGDFGYGFGEWVMEKSNINNLTTTVTSPGLFGSFPWVDNKNNYCAFMMTYYLNNKGRNERYKALKKLIDDAVNNSDASAKN